MTEAAANSTPSNRIGFLDGLRGLAALYVMLGHARWLLWEGYSTGYVLDPSRYSVIEKILAYLSLTLNYGHQAVIFFFVLSGFVIHLRYARDQQRDPNSQFALLPFLARRLLRIYPLFLFAMILTAAVDYAGIAARLPIYFEHTPYALINQNVIVNYSLPAVIGNALLIPNAETWGTNGPLWSLRYEWFFYLSYPLFWLINRRSIRLATGIVAALFALSFVIVGLPLELIRVVAAAFPAWWMGALLAEIYVRRLSLRFVQIAPLAALFAVLPFTIEPFMVINPVVQDFLWGLGFTGLLLRCTSHGRDRGGSLRLLERLRWFRDISYAPYADPFPDHRDRWLADVTVNDGLCAATRIWMGGSRSDHLRNSSLVSTLAYREASVGASAASEI
ncbi:MAG: acyltransferase [Anaerolineae bacterium]